MEMPIQVNGKFMGTLHDHDLDMLVGKYVEKLVVVPGKLVNIVAIPMKLEAVPVEPDPPHEIEIPEIPL